MEPFCFGSKSAGSLAPYISCPVCVFSHVWLYATPWTVAHQAPLSMELFRQEYWGRLPVPSPGDLPDPWIEPASPESPALASGFFATAPLGEPIQTAWWVNTQPASWLKTSSEDTKLLSQLGNTCKERKTRSLLPQSQSFITSDLSLATATLKSLSLVLEVLCPFVWVFLGFLFVCLFHFIFGQWGAGSG